MLKIKKDPLLGYLKNKKINLKKITNWDFFLENLKLNELSVQFYLGNKHNKHIPEEAIRSLKNKKINFDKFLSGVDYFLNLMKKKNFNNFIVIKLKNKLKAHTDFDVLVSKEDSLKLKKILEDENFTIKDSIGYEVGLQKEIDGRNFVVDIHCEISYNNSTFLKIEDIFKNTQKKEYCKRSINFCSDENDFIITLIHSFFQKVAVRRTLGFNQLKWSEITLSDLCQLRESSENKKFNWDYVIETAKQFGWENALIYYLTALDIFFPKKERKKILNSIDLKNKQSNFKKEIINSESFPIYTKISTTYLICFSKLKKEFSKNPIKGIIYAFNMHKWFVSNGIRIVYHKTKK